ncbi:MAG: PIN domain-containing protein [Chloroflexi bacterium]|nr:PIN domain-containing protein [Chloroflexota bacterium]
MRHVLIDTGAIYAFVTRTDEHHQQAQTFVSEFQASNRIFVLADLVFVEAMILFKARAGAQIAVQVGRELRQNRIYQWTVLGADGERDTWGLFQQYDDKNWSYTDCALLALSRRLKIKEIFTFDAHFGQMPGIVRLPKTG